MLGRVVCIIIELGTTVGSSQSKILYEVTCLTSLQSVCKLLSGPVELTLLTRHLLLVAFLLPDPPKIAFAARFSRNGLSLEGSGDRVAHLIWDLLLELASQPCMLGM